MMLHKKTLLLLLLTSSSSSDQTAFLASAFVTPSTRFGVVASRRGGNSCSTTVSPRFSETAVADTAEADTSDVPAETVELSATDDGAVSEEIVDSPVEEGIEEASSDAAASDVDGAEASEGDEFEEVEEKERFTAYVKNLPYTSMDDDLETLFAPFGTIESVSIPRQPGGQAKGFAFVEMSSEEELLAAIEGTNGNDIAGREIKVSRSLPRDQLPRRNDPDQDRSKKVYVGNLPFGVEGQDVRELFEQHGEVEDVYVPRDLETGRIKGFGFVTFTSEDAIDAVIEATNGVLFEGRRLNVSRPLPSGQKAEPVVNEDRARIYVGNLSFDTQAETLQELFQQHGEVIDLFINEDRVTGMSRGFGFCTMPKEDSEAAIEALNGVEVDGREIKVTLAAEKILKTRIYIGNIDFGTTEETIRTICEEFGDILDLYMPVSRYGDGHRGFAIVTMAKEAAENVLRELEGVEVDGRTLEVTEAKPKGAPSQASRPQPVGTRIYVGNISFYTPAETLKEIFSEFGEVIDCFVPLDRETNSSKGFAFVTMHPEDAQSAIDGLNDVEVDGRYIQVAEALQK